MVDEFATVGGGKPLLHFLEEPFIVVDHAFHGFNHQRLAIAALLGGKAGELCLQVGAQMHFHGSSLGNARNRVNNPNHAKADKSESLKHVSSTLRGEKLEIGKVKMEKR